MKIRSTDRSHLQSDIALQLSSYSKIYNKLIVLGLIIGYRT